MQRLDELRRRYLAAMGIDLWLPRGAADAGRTSAEGAHLPATADPEADEARVAAPAGDAAVAAPDRDVGGLDWDALEARVLGCTLCELHETRTQAVFGFGDRGARWLVVGEAPGADEDRQGEPFVGRAGQLLNAMLKAVGLARGQVYIANILKCRPPNNRDPRPEEVVCCEPYLMRQIALIRPALILAVGRIAAQNLLKTTTPIGRLRGRVHSLPGADVPVVVTYHPAYLLRSPLEKRKAWADLQLAVKTAAPAAD